ncbi:hypothetical protein E8E11_000476 [Didymella keratinophila]|nr:hypothetical protein E8E11_000476 [Didymella keratinophila]
MASIMENNERMKTDLDTMMELYWYLQTKPKEEVGDALSAIQAGANPSEVMEAIKGRASASDGSPTSSTAFDTTPTETPPTLDHQFSNSDSHSSRQFAQSTSPTGSDGSRTPCEIATVPSPTRPASGPGAVMMKSSLQRTIDSLGRGAAAFFMCTGCIFHIYDQVEAEKMLDDVRPYLENAGKSWLELVFQGSIPTHLKPALCSLCIMAAVGLQYTKNPIPALGFQASGEDGSFELVSVFYESARQLLESVIEVNILEATKICAALCIFNTIGHATVAMAYADMGINFVLSLGPSLQYRPKSLGEDAWINYKRVARTLVTLRSWLITTLGYIHKENAALQTGIHWLVDAHDLTPNETIQQELNKVVQIEVNLLRTINRQVTNTISPRRPNANGLLASGTSHLCC